LGNVFIEKGNLKVAMEMFEKAVEEKRKKWRYIVRMGIGFRSLL
jgi:predicted negative regulator of RcsB-dependent stress response